MSRPFSRFSPPQVMSKTIMENLQNRKPRTFGSRSELDSKKMRVLLDLVLQILHSIDKNIVMRNNTTNNIIDKINL